ncbi:MAG: hypothetical protein AAFV97_04030, partial [Bacteroidota bacterium]
MHTKGCRGLAHALLITFLLQDCGLTVSTELPGQQEVSTQSAHDFETQSSHDWATDTSYDPLSNPATSPVIQSTLNPIVDASQLVADCNHPFVAQGIEDAIVQWLQAYVDCFADLDFVQEDVGTLTNYLEEYKLLAHIRPTEETQQPMCSYWQGILQKLTVPQLLTGHRAPLFASMITYVFSHIDIHLFEKEDLLLLLD